MRTTVATNRRLACLLSVCTLTIVAILPQPIANAAMNANVGAYYFEGWWWYEGDPSHPAYFATQELQDDFPGRCPTFSNGANLFRDDTLPIMEQQIDLAANHGVSFFNFDWYWVHNEDSTRDPFTMNGGMYRYLEASNNNRMQFAVTLAALPSTTEDWQTTADILIPIFSDPKYQRVGGKPLVSIFGNLTQDAHDLLQARAIAAGLPGLSFAQTGGSGATSLYDHTTRYNTRFGSSSPFEMPASYTSLTSFTEGYWDTDSNNLQGDQKYIPTLMSGWDSRPGSTDNEGLYFDDRTPEEFAIHVQNAIDWIENNPDKTTSEKILMLYAWNEYVEGGYIAPTVGDPNGLYLDALKSVIGVPEPGSLVLLGAALIGLMGYIWRKQR